MFEFISYKILLVNFVFKFDYEMENSEGYVKFQYIDEDYLVYLRKVEENLDINVIRVLKLVKIFIDSYIDMDKGIKFDEYVVMEEYSKKIMKYCESEEKLEIMDIYK